MKRLRILALMHPQLVPPDSLDGHSEEEINVWKTEYDVVSHLRAIGHEVRALGVQYELLPIRDAVEEWKPHTVFNLLEEFHGEVLFDQNVVSFLELLKVPYTGCNPRGMIISRGKALSKKLFEIENELYQTKNQSSQDPLNYPIKLNNKIAAVLGAVQMSDTAPTRQESEVFEDLATKVNAQLRQLDTLMKNDLTNFNKMAKDAAISEERSSRDGRSFGCQAD